MSRYVAIGIAVLLVIAVGVWWFVFRGEDRETHVVQSGSIDVTIQTIGRVQSTGATTVRTQVPGEVMVVAAEPGDAVVGGDIIVQLNTVPLERAIAAAERGVEEAEFALLAAQRQADQNPDDENLAFAVIQAGQRVDAAEQSLQDARDALRNAAIQAPRDGILMEVLIRSGDLLNRSQPVFVLYARDDLQVIANVDELDLVNVSIGAPARLRLDSYPAEEIPGTVVSTAPMAREQGGATVFATTLSLDIPENIDIRPGMNADVTIVTEARENVLLIPQEAIRSVGERAYVQVLTNGDQQEREVILGYRSGGQVEVVSGISEGDRIVVR
jgi:RND family efflux transporter MFP subunit